MSRDCICGGRAGVEVWHILVQPRIKVGDFSIDSQSILSSTAKSPTNNTNERHPVILSWVSSNKRTSTVSLTSILASCHEASAEHIISHVVVHGTTVAISKDCHIDFMEPGVEKAARSDSSPSRDDGIPWEHLACCCGKTGWFDVGVVSQGDCFSKDNNRNVVGCG